MTSPDLTYAISWVVTVVADTALASLFFLISLVFGGIYMYRVETEGMPEDPDLKEIPPVTLG